MLSQHIILRIVTGRTQLPSRSFTRGEAVPQFSVGSRGDWIVSGAGVASFHVLLTFDGEHVFAAAVDPASSPVFLKGAPIGNTWHVVTAATELHFGEASLIVSREASLAPPAGASPPRPPKPDHRDLQLPPHTVRQAPVTAKHTGPGNTQFFESLRAQVEPGAASSPPVASADAVMAAVAPTIARQPPTTFPMEPHPAAASPSGAFASTAMPPSGALQSSAALPPMISSPGRSQPSAPPPIAPVQEFPTAFSPQGASDVPLGALPPLPGASPMSPGPLPMPPGALPMPPEAIPPGALPVPLGALPMPPGAFPMPAGNMATLPSEGAQGRVSAPGWSGANPIELPTHFAPAGSIALPPGSTALPPGSTPTALAPTDDGAPLPLAMPFAMPPLPLPPNADGEPFSTVGADADAIRNFAAHLPPSPPDPPLPPDAGYSPYMQSQYMQSQTPPPGDASYMPPYLDSQTPPPYAPEPRFSQSPRAARSRGGSRLLLILLPILFVMIILAVVAYLVIR